MSLSINNVVRVTVLSALKGLANVNTSSLALFTSEVPLTTLGTSTNYLDAIGVAKDFGTSSG